MTNEDRDILIVGINAFDEASDQGQAGIRAQVHSVINRHNAGRWYSRKTLAATVMVPFAYSAQNTSDPNRVRGMEAPMDDAVLKLCMDEAAMAISGTTDDPTIGGTHYYRAGTPEPSWVHGIDSKTGNRVAPPAVYTCRIGAHLFYKEVA